MVDTSGSLFREAFLQVLADKLPYWKRYIADSTSTSIEVRPPKWDGSPFRIHISSDTVSVFPLCDFGLDYISTANREDLEQRPQLVFAKVISDIADFVNRRTVVVIKRRRWLFMKAGWDVQFVPFSAADAARRSGASIINWPA
jgi:hypothetical protein